MLQSKNQVLGSFPAYFQVLVVELVYTIAEETVLHVQCLAKSLARVAGMDVHICRLEAGLKLRKLVEEGLYSGLLLC